MIKRNKHFSPHQVEMLLNKRDVKEVVEPVAMNNIFKKLIAHVKEPKSVVKTFETETIFTKLKNHVMEARQIK